MTAFVTGLPRCRTNWFAQYLDGIEGVTAHHELLNGLKSKQEFYDAMEGCVVNSDSGLFVTDFAEHWPDAPVVVIHRNVDEVYSSLTAFLGKHGYGKPSYEFLKDQESKVSQIKGLHVRYEDIDSRLQEITEYLGFEYDEEYAQSMTASNLQMNQLTVDINSYQLWGAF